MKRALLDLDPDFRDPARLRDWLIRSVATSTAIETGGSVKTISKDLRDFLDARARRAQRPRASTISVNSRRIGS
jgi:hypothetical protein